MTDADVQERDDEQFLDWLETENREQLPKPKVVQEAEAIREINDPEERERRRVELNEKLRDIAMRAYQRRGIVLG